MMEKNKAWKMFSAEQEALAGHSSEKDCLACRRKEESPPSRATKKKGSRRQKLHSWQVLWGLRVVDQTRYCPSRHQLLRVGPAICFRESSKRFQREVRV